MRRLAAWPRSLFGRVAAIVMAGFAVAYGLSFWSVMRERADLADTMMLAYVGRDVGSSVAILDRLPPAEREAWLPRLARANYWFSLDAVPDGPVQAPPPALALHLWPSLLANMGSQRLVRASADKDATALIEIRLTDGSPVSLHVLPPKRGVRTATALLLLLQISVVGACVWWAVRLATRPLRELAQAATRLGNDPQAPALVEEGPHEVQGAAAAFNAMQRRIAAHMAERMHILAAISHDLQSPITRMRVRTDLLADEVLREKLQADLLAMQRLVEEGLAYARTAHASTEKEQKVDLPALLDALACDHIDAGRQLTLHLCAPCVIHTRPQALRRIIDNLIDNAMKFAGSAEIALRCEGGKVDILVSDRGPGIPPDQIALAMQPFSRLETSRNRDTGGSGLGLAIAQGLSRALGGDLTLLNRSGGGLEAVVSLRQAGAGSNGG